MNRFDLADLLLNFAADPLILAVGLQARIARGHAVGLLDLAFELMKTPCVWSFVLDFT
jgi:hypothetical protein